MYREAGLPEDSVKKLNFCEFNNRKNIINTLNAQSGTEYTIVPHSQKERNSNFVQMMFEVVAKYASGLSPLIGKAFSLLAPGGIGMELPSDHSLSNFNEVFVQKSGIVKDKNNNIISMQEAYSNITPLEYDSQLASKIKDLKQTGKTNDKPEFSMDKIDEVTGKVDRVTFSSNELQKATRLVEAERVSTNGKVSFADKFPPRTEGNIVETIINSKTTI